MDLQINGEWIFNGAVSIAIFFIGVWFRSLDSKLAEMKSELNKVKDNYQSKEIAKIQAGHTDKLLNRILKEVEMLNHKLDNKVDK